jgi:hypothetical protein
MANKTDNAPISFVLPRTIAQFEGAALRIARRAALPLRAVGQRATSFADRIVGGWLDGRRAPVAASQPVPSMAASRVGAPLVMPRPWYELPSEVQAAQAMVRRPAPSRAPVVVPEAAPPAEAVESPAERGAQIARTQLDAPPPITTPVAPIIAPAAPSEAARTVATELAASAVKVAAAERSVSEAVRRAEQAQPAPGSESRAPEAPQAAVSTPVTTAEAPRVREATVAEMLGAVAPAYLPDPVYSAPRPTAFARAFQHAEWVSARLAAAQPELAASPAQSQAARSAGYVFVAPSAEPAVVEHARRDVRATAPMPGTAIESQPLVAPPAPELFEAPRAPSPVLVTEELRGAAPRLVAAPAAAPLFESALPDLRAPAASPAPAAPTAAARIDSFLARLAGVQASHDSQALPLFSDVTGAAGESFSSLVTRAPGRSWVEVAAERGEPTPAQPAGPQSFSTVAPVVPPAVRTSVDASPSLVAPAAELRERAETFAAAVEQARAASAPARVVLEAPRPAPLAPIADAWRPGNVAARAERLGVSQELRAHRVWGEAAPSEAARPVASTRAAALGSSVYSYVAPAAAAVPATQVAAPRPTAVATAIPGAPGAVWSAAPLGPASTVRFLDQLAGIDGARAVSPLSLTHPTTPSPAAVVVQSWSAPAPAVAAQARRAPERVSLTAAPAPRAEQAAATSTAMRLGGVAVRAEQLAGVVGVRAAGLSLDFVDPAKVPALTGGRGSAELSYLWPALGPALGPTLAANAQSSPAPSLSVSREEWDLVATFPSTATASQVRAARQAQAWSGVSAAPASQTRSAPPAMTVLSSAPARGSFSAPAVRAAERAAVPAARIAEPSLPSQGQTVSMDTLRPSRGEARGDFSQAPSVVAARAPFATSAAEWVAPTVKSDRASLPGGRMPRGSFTWSRASEFTPPGAREFAPVTSASQVQAPSDPAAVAPLWQMAPARPVLTPEMGAPQAFDSTGMPVAAPGVSPDVSARQAVRARVAETQRLASVAPFLELFRGGLSPVPPSRAAAEFTAQSTPLVTAAAPISAAPPPVQSMVQALQKSAPSSGGDDRVSLADLTLIAMASATQQVAAAEEGGRPAASAAGAAPPAGAAAGAGAGKGGAPPPDLDDLARKVFKELQRLLDVARERSGSSWES